MTDNPFDIDKKPQAVPMRIEVSSDNYVFTVHGEGAMSQVFVDGKRVSVEGGNMLPIVRMLEDYQRNRSDFMRMVQLLKSQGSTIFRTLPSGEKVFL